MSHHEITYQGTIQFDLDNVTKKHENQSSWKRTAMVLFNGEICQYYQWFILKRYNLRLNSPLRGFHCSFINDRFTDVKGDTLEDRELLWNLIKTKYNNKEINITLNLDIRTNAEYWWFNVAESSRNDLQLIRNELGLDRPYFGLHLTIGNCNEKTIHHSEYIHRLLDKGLIT